MELEITRMGVVYHQHANGTLTCGPLDQSGMVGGTGEEDRNLVDNPARLQRILAFQQGRPNVFDYGCGNGLLVKFLRDNGLLAVGFDRYAQESEGIFNHINIQAWNSSVDVMTMIEVVEHLSEPYKEFDYAFKMLKPGGVLMIETSFTDWMDLQNDPYINPSIGHSTIFSHKGLDELMLAKGFEVYGHINRNVRVYQKPEPAFDPRITLITMGQSNPVALKRTLDSFKGVVDEFIFGDVLIFDSDRTIIEKYKEEYNLRIIPLPFNYIFEKGFAHTLNTLAAFATNDWALYMNVSEVIDGEHPIKEQMSKDYNCYSFDHAADPHRWFRLYNRKELSWGGLIHEEVIGDIRACPFHIFRMKDTEKDLDDPFKAKVSNDCKEIVYFAQYLRLVDRPELRGNTHQGWIDYATQSYDSLKERLLKKGKRFGAFVMGNLTQYLEDIYTNPEFEEERFKSSDLINFQGDRKLL